MKAIKEVFFIKRNEHKHDEWTRVGVVFKRETGSLVLKLDVVPVNFDGWLEILDVKSKDEFTE